MALKLAIIIFAFGYIISEVLYKHKTTGIFDFLNGLMNNAKHPLLLFAVLLMPFNWGIEIFKWGYLMKPLEQLGLKDAVSAVLSGVTVSIFTPNRIGEFGGRVFVLKQENRWQGVVLTIAGSMSQLVVTIVTGCLAMLFFYPALGFEPVYEYLIIVSAVAGFIIICILYFNMSVIYALLLRFGVKEQVLKYIRIIKTLGVRKLANVLVLSFMRYIVFSLQFYLLFLWCGLELPLLHSLMLTSVIFFFLTAVPTIALSEFGVRGTIAVFVFGLYALSFSSLPAFYDMAVVSAAFFLWVINLAVPAVVGSVFVLRLRIFKK